MFYINNAFLHLELPKSEQISISRGKQIKNTCCPICRQAVPSFSCRPTQKRADSHQVSRQPLMRVATLGQWSLRLACKELSTDGDDQVRLWDFRGCCKPAVSGLGGYRPGLPEEERDGGNPASRLSPATGCQQSSTRFEGHV